MNDLQVFSNPKFGELRTLEIDGQPWFVGNDVAKALGFEKPRNAIAQHVAEDDALKQGITDALGRTQETTIINESGMYSLIFGSKLKSAKEFKRWVTHEVLPAIRRTGGYMVAKANETPEELMARALLVAQDTMRRQERQIAEMKPKAIFSDAVSASHTTILIGELAKLLKQNGIETGGRRLFAWMRENGFLGTCGNNYNIPTQRAMEMGLFEIKETVIAHADGHTSISRTPKVTGKGQNYFVNKFLNDSLALQN